MTSLELLQEIDAWLSFNNSPSKEQISELRNDIKKHISEQLNILHVVQQSEQFYCTCSRAKGLDHDEEGMPYCIECQKPVQ